MHKDGPSSATQRGTNHKNVSQAERDGGRHPVRPVPGLGRRPCTDSEQHHDDAGSSKRVFSGSDNSIGAANARRTEHDERRATDD